MDGQMNIFDFLQKDTESLRINKKIRIIEMFSGIGAQAKAFENLERDGFLPNGFEKYKTSEWEYNAVLSYKAVHFPNDNTDYSQGKTKVQIAEELHQYGISSNGNAPLFLGNILRIPEKKMRDIYNAFKATHNLGSIKNIHSEDLGIVEKDKYTYLLTYSFPCFPKGSLVLTKDGYKDISEIVPGDVVLSHDREWNMVTESRCTGTKRIVEIDSMGMDCLRCTPNHMFYVRKMKRAGHFCTRTFLEPEWMPAQDLDNSYYLGIPVIKEEEMPEWKGIDAKTAWGHNTHKNCLNGLVKTREFWWIVGRWLGDGWTRPGRVIISCDKRHSNELKNRIEKTFHCCVSSENTADKIHICSTEFQTFLDEYGKGASNKHLTPMALKLPVSLAKELICGYESSDGYMNGKTEKILSVSRELLLGIGQLVAKVYHRPYSLRICQNGGKQTICGRVVNIKKSYELAYKKGDVSQDKAFYENGYVWYPMYGVTDCGEEEVFDITVENSHSFTVQNTIVHNCTDISNAGASKGLGTDTRSGLLWEVQRIFLECVSTNSGKVYTEKLPDILMLENVPPLVGKKFRPEFEKWCRFLESIGYTNAWTILNAKNYGIPQNRERVFMWSWLGKAKYEFPKPLELDIRLKDVLEDSVDEKYYLSDKAVQGLTRQLDFNIPPLS